MLSLLLESTKTCNLSVAGFSLPGEKTFRFWVQDTESDLPFVKDTEFLIHPFYTADAYPIVSIKPQWNFYEGDELPASLRKKINKANDKEKEFWTSLIDGIPLGTEKFEYITQVKKIKEKISRGIIEKAMLSAVRIKKRTEKKILDILRDLRNYYPEAFVSYTSTPFHGTWIGATPEVLIYQEGRNLETVSLAGTKTKEQMQEWGEKEIHEQEIVTQYINGILKKYPVDKIQIEGPEFYSIGELTHLRTRFHIIMQKEPQRELIYQIANEMHPTPAVGAYPKTPGLSIIRGIEKHARSYYAGFLGPITPGSTFLFVNLRCASMFKNHLAFYSGAGITAGSDPELEWEETGNKAASVANFF